MLSKTSDADDESTASGSEAGDGAFMGKTAVVKPLTATITTRRSAPPRFPMPTQQLQPAKVRGSVDLIDFPSLIPTPPPATPATPALSHSGSASPSPPSSPFLPPSKPATRHRTNTNVTTTPTSKPDKVFVPVGESATRHIAEAKLRRAAERVKTFNPDTKIVGLQKQIQALQKSKINGLAASRWASAPAEALHASTKARKSAMSD